MTEGRSVSGLSAHALGILVFAIGASSCGQQSQRKLSGHIKLEYEAEVGPAFIFELSNESTITIRFDGWHGLDGVVSPSGGAYSYACYRTEGGETLFGMPVAEFHGPKTETIDVTPGKELRLAIPGARFPPIGAGKCRLSLILHGGAKIDSPEFLR